jgi:hypothetical protein
MKFYKVLKLSICFLLLNYLSALSANEYEIAIGAIFKNDKPYLKEWIEFHRLVGIEHFYLYNNLSTDHPEEVLEPYIKAGIVELVDWPFSFNEREEWVSIQDGAYNDILKRARGYAKWVAFIDTDEFLFPSKEETLLSVLKEFESFGGVAVNWQLYGTSNIDKISQDKLMIEMLTYKAKKNYRRNEQIKSIVQPERVIRMDRVHCAKYKEGFFQVNTNKETFRGHPSPYVVINKLRINHYWTRTKDYFENVKLASRKKRGWDTKEDISISKILNDVKDTSILRFVPQLREKMQFKNKKEKGN